MKTTNHELTGWSGGGALLKLGGEGRKRRRGRVTEEHAGKVLLLHAGNVHAQIWTG